VAQFPEGVSPPYDPEAEMSVLGSVLLDNDVLDDVQGILSAEDFYHRANRAVFEAMRDLGEHVDVVTLNAELERRGQLDEVGGKKYLAELMEAVPSAKNAEAYARLVRDAAVRRRLMHAADEIRGAALTGGKSSELIDFAEQRVFEIQHAAAKSGTVRVGDVLLDVFKQIESLEGSQGGITGVDTGFYQLNDMTSGFQPGDLIVVAARPSMGKTTFVLNCALNAAKAGKSVLFFSLEMGKEQIVTNMLCCEAKVDAGRVRRGQMTQHDWQLWSDAADRLHRLKIFVDATPGLSPVSVRTKCRRLFNREKSLDFVIIDYLQLMGAPDAESRQQEIALISRNLKELAREMRCPVIALSQLNRALEARKDHRPMMSDLRESGAIEQDADLIVFLHREDYYAGENIPSDYGRTTEIIVAKQRNGRTGKIELLFFPSQFRFENKAEGAA
jgi:replicative DNA helicase